MSIRSHSFLVPDSLFCQNRRCRRRIETTIFNGSPSASITNKQVHWNFNPKIPFFSVKCSACDHFVINYPREWPFCHKCKSVMEFRLHEDAKWQGDPGGLDIWSCEKCMRSPQAGP